MTEGLEVLEVKGWDGKVAGTASRAAAEALGVKTAPVDIGGTVWFTREQAEALRRDPTWRDGAIPTDGAA
jgi:hypothetical protein